MATRYKVVQDASLGSQDPLKNVIPHPDQPTEGFTFATEANIFCVERDLDGSWYVIPVEGA